MSQEIKSAAFRGVKWTVLSSLFTGVGYLTMLMILVRILPEAVFGMFAVANIAAGLGNLGADLGFSQAIVQKENISSTQLSTLYWINLFLAISLFSFSFPIGWFMEVFYNLEGLSQVVIFTMLSLIPNALGLQFYSLLQKKLCFKELAISEIIGNAFLIIVTLLLALSGFEIWALVFGLLTGKSVQAGLYMYFGQKIHRPQWLFSRADMAEFWHFGFFQTGRTLLVYLSGKTDAIIIGKMIGVPILGIYEVIKDLLMRPISLINPVIGRVAFPLLARQQTNISVFSMVFRKTLEIFNSLTAILFVGSFLYADFLTGWVLGEKWIDYSNYLQLLSVALFLHFSVSPMGDLITASGKPQIGFYWNIFNLFITSVSLVIAGRFGLQGILNALIILNVGKILLAWIFIIKPLSGISFQITAVAIIKPLFIAWLSGIASVSLFSFLPDGFIIRSISIVVYLLFCLILSAKMNKTFHREFISLIRTITL